MRGARLHRREFLGALGAALVTACTRSTESGVKLAMKTAGAAHPPVELHSVFDLPPDDLRSRELSGIAWDGAANVMWAVQDELPIVVALTPDRDLKTWGFSDSVRLEYKAPLDLEGIVVVKDGFIVCSEIGPRIVEFGRDGQFKSEIVLPERFRDARHNKSLESLTLSPSGRYLFTTTEVALPRDGDFATPAAGTRVRLVRIDRQTGEIAEYAYATDPSPYAKGDWGVADLAALSDNELLVLERGWAALRGNTARIHRVTLDETTSCGMVDKLSAATPALTKRLVVDVGHIVAKGLPEPKQPQPTSLMDNYEGLAIGPLLEDGRHTVIVISDDNAHANQVARILVLACA